MQKNKTELYELISDLRTKKDFEKEIKNRYKSYGELVDHDTIALLLVDELGRNKQSITKIANLAPDADYSVVGKIISISDSKTFKRKNGTPGKVVNLEIGDDTGTCRLVLWNGDIDLIKNKEIQPGTTVKIINGYTKLGYTGGMEINLGRWGFLEVEPVDTSQANETLKNNENEITGILLRKEATKSFFKDNGEFGFVTTITIKEQNSEKDITLWDRCVKDIQVCKIGDTITLSNVTRKQSQEKTELHANGNGTIKKHQ
jgi:replication factor A1